jgi:hypothetical protein
MSRQLGDRSVFDRTHGPAVGASGDGLEGAYSAILNSTPSAGTVKVIVPNLWGLTTVRSANCSLAFAGSPGDRVLLVFDEEKQPWVISPSRVDATTVLSGKTPVTSDRATWTALPYSANWGNYGGAFQVGEYCIDQLGFVHIRGLIEKSTTYSAGETIATLPAGYRPAASEIFTCMAQDGTMGTMLVRIDVLSSGLIQLQSGSSVPAYSSPGTMGWLSLEDRTFMQGN